MSTIDKLVYMANQIALNFSSRGEAVARAATAEHVARYWDPAMKAKIVKRLGEPDHGLSATAAWAIELVRASAETGAR